MEQTHVTKIEKIALKLLEQLKSEGLSFRDAQLVVSQTANLLNREMEKRIFLRMEFFMDREIRRADVKEAAQLLNTGEWIATGAVLNEDGSVADFVCKKPGSYVDMFRVYSWICEIREADTKEAAQLLNTGEWVATCAAVGENDSIKFFSCGRIGEPDNVFIGWPAE